MSEKIMEWEEWVQFGKCIKKIYDFLGAEIMSSRTKKGARIPKRNQKLIVKTKDLLDEIVFKDWPEKDRECFKVFYGDLDAVQH